MPNYKFVSAQRTPLVVYCGWNSDPTTTMTIHWHRDKIAFHSPRIYYRKKGLETWNTKLGTKRNYPGIDGKYNIHWCELSSLDPDTLYEFWIKDEGVVREFKTMPLSLGVGETLKVVIGGDFHQFRDGTAIINVIKNVEPDIIICGGDFTDSDGFPVKFKLWMEFWEKMQPAFTENKRLVPIIPCIGNHEVQGGYGGSKETAPFFYSMFSFPQDGYGVLDFGDYLSIIILDTDHTNWMIHQSTNTGWLDNRLSERVNIPNIIPVYHVPGYPSQRDFSGTYSKRVRDNFHPVFDAHDIKYVFENHEHVYKKTPPIKQGEVNVNGVVYLGDGLTGAEPRTPDYTRWYMEESDQLKHIHVVTVDSSNMSVDRVTQ